jgi:WXXGXW repeat (2 copies)
MQRRSVIRLTLFVPGGFFGLLLTGAQAQPLNRAASNIRPSDTRTVIAPALPAPPVPSADPPSAFLIAARRAVVIGRTGEAQEALERAETRLLGRGVPPTLDAPPTPARRERAQQQAVLAIGAARRALAAHDRAAAIDAIDDALAADNRPLPEVKAEAVPATVAAPPTPRAPVPPPEPVITHALLPGHWALHGARYVWVPPETTPRGVQSAAVVPGTYLWRNGAYVWVPTHYAN